MFRSSPSDASAACEAQTAPPRVSPLREPAGAAAAAAAARLLERAREAARRLKDSSDEEALHDFRVAVRRLHTHLRAWRPALKGRLRPKPVRLLARIISDTNALRDDEVLADWLRDHRHALGPRGRVRALGLLRELDRRRWAQDGRARRAIAKRFRRAVQGLRRRLARDGGGSRAGEAAFGLAAAALLRRRARKLASRLRRLEEAAAPRKRADAERLARRAHKTRIGAKRLRYLLEPLAEARADCFRAVQELRTLQDLLGELHDRTVFAERIARASAEGRALAAAERLLESQRRALLAEVRRRWLGGAAESFRKRVDQLARGLEAACYR